MADLAIPARTFTAAGQAVPVDGRTVTGDPAAVDLPSSAQVDDTVIAGLLAALGWACTPPAAPPAPPHAATVALRDVFGFYPGDGTTGAQQTMWRNLLPQFPHALNVLVECSNGSVGDVLADTWGAFVGDGSAIYGRGWQNMSPTPRLVTMSMPLTFGGFGLAAHRSARDAAMSGADHGAILPAASVAMLLQATISGANDAAWAGAALRMQDPRVRWNTRIGWESTGNWYPWSSGGNEALFAAAFRRVVTVMRANGYRGLFEWNCMGQQGWPPGGISVAAFPGADVVDLVGLDIYLDGSAVVDPALAPAEAFAAAHGLALSLSEIGTKAADNGAGAAALVAALAALPATGPGALVNFCWFNSNNGGATSVDRTPRIAAVLAGAAR